MSLFESASLCVTPNGTKASKLYAIKPTDGSGDLSVTRATSGDTRVNASGLIETVSANVPRLDYSNGSCPSILVEPQRTNLVLRSQEFDNIAWTKFSSTVTTNSVISPDGTQNADTATFTGDINSSVLRQSVILTIGSTYTFSIYARTPSGTGTMSIDLGDGSNVTRTINSSWNRYTFTLVAGAFPHIDISSTTASTYYLWGAQLELASYATSYIPTVASAVTRNADVISKTGISSLIGQTEGTIFVDFYYTQNSGSSIVSIFNTAVSNSIFFETFNNILYLTIITSGALVCQIPFTTLTNQNYKIAVGYKLNDIVFYVNGSQAGVDTSATIPATNEINLGFLGASFTQQKTNINTTALWKTRLTNAELAEITTL